MLTTSESPSDAVAATLAEAESLLRTARVDEAIRLLVEHNRVEPHAELERYLIHVRHHGYRKVAEKVGAEDWPPPHDDRFADTPGIPEVDAVDLDVEALRAGVLGSGALIVRGLLSPERVDVLRGVLDETFDALAGKTADEAEAVAPWYAPFKPLWGYQFGFLERAFSRYGGGVLGAEAPRALFTYLEAMGETGLLDLIEEHLGERPALSVKKTTMRRMAPDVDKGWHQDGSFLGLDTRTINVWLALTDAGEHAPGIDLVSRRLDGLVPTGTEGAEFDWSVSPTIIDEMGDVVARPVFAPGDAVLFDQYSLHCTATDPSMTRDRCAIESWYFAQSTFPEEQIPLYL